MILVYITNVMLIAALEKIAVEMFYQLPNDPQFRKQAYNAGVKILDYIQVSTGNVNLNSPEKAIEIAVDTCIRKDTDSLARVVSFVTALYLQHDIERAAQVGGSLLKRFGKSWFPHIKNRELRFAAEVDSELEDYLYNQIVKTAS